MQIQLTISLLASNRVHSLERCLDSLTPLLMQVPSELIIVFTSENEAVREVASRYTDQIIPFTWRDDFAAARNVGLKMAKGEWFLYIDDDEWFEDVTEIRDFFLSGEYKSYSSGFYIQRNYEDWDGIRHTDFHAFRMARRVPGLRFQNPIHEELSPGNGPFKYFNAYVHHYGYVTDTKGGKTKTSRNIPMLLKSIEEKPDYLKNYLQITKEYYIDKNWEKALEYCEKGRKLCEKQRLEPYRIWLQAYLAIILVKRYDKCQAAAKIEKILDEKPCELVRALLYGFLTGLYTEQKEVEKALSYGKKFEQLLKYLDEHPKLWEQQRYGDITKDVVVDPERVLGIRLNALSCALYAGSWEDAEEFLHLLPWEEEYRMQKHYPRFDHWKERYAPRFGELLAGLPYESPYLMIQKPEKGAALLVRCMNSTEDKYLRSQVVKEALFSKRGLCEIAWTMDLDSWKASVSQIVEKTRFEDVGELVKAAELLKEGALLQGLWLEQLTLERTLRQGYLTRCELTDALKNYGECILSFYREQYKSEMFEEEKRPLLPRECRFALLVLEALKKIDSGQPAEAVRLFRVAVKVYPGLTGAIQEVLRLVLRDIDDPAAKAGEEFSALAVQMKGALKDMIKRGQYAEALPIVTQLSKLLPEDLEFLRMRQKILRQTSVSRV